MVKRGEVYLVNLNPTVSSKVQKRCDPVDVSSAKQRACPHVRAPRETRPCVVVSPDEMNQYIRTIVIAPMTTKQRNYKSRVAIDFNGKQGQIMLDRIRTIDKRRLISKLGKLSIKDLRVTLSVIQEMFTY